MSAWTEDTSPLDVLAGDNWWITSIFGLFSLLLSIALGHMPKYLAIAADTVETSSESSKWNFIIFLGGKIFGFSVRSWSYNCSFQTESALLLWLFSRRMLFRCFLKRNCNEFFVVDFSCGIESLMGLNVTLWTLGFSSQDDGWYQQACTSWTGRCSAIHQFGMP